MAARTNCSKCGNSLDGSHKSYCKACFATYMRQRVARDPEAFRAYWKEQNSKHSEKKAQYFRDRYEADREFWNEYNREWRKNNKESRKQTRRKRTLKEKGLTLDEFAVMWTDQGGMCAVCSKEMIQGERGSDTAVVDHNHETGAVRALLCSNCNRALGLLAENEDTFVAAAAYLIRHASTKDANSEGGKN